MSRLQAVLRWTVALVGAGLLVVALGGLALDNETFIVDAAERGVPVLVSVALVGVNVWLRDRSALSARETALVAAGTVAGGLLFVLFQGWMLFLVGFESPLPSEVDYLLLNSGAVGALAGALLGYQYLRLRQERDRLTELTEDVQRTNRQLEAKVKRLDEFASVVSHDLRNPISVAQGYLDFARESGDADHFDTVETALDRAETITTEMLELARQGKAVTDPDPVDLDAVVAEAWETTDTGNVSMSAATGMTVEADESRLRRMFENLFRNALDHAGSDLTTVRVASHGGDGFAVEDDGAGIDPAKADGVFDAGYSSADEGTGYGLAIVQSIVDAHGWRVSVSPAESGGARFEFEGVETVGSA